MLSHTHNCSIKSLLPMFVCSSKSRVFYLLITIPACPGVLYGDTCHSKKSINLSEIFFSYFMFSAEGDTFIHKVKIKH